MSESNHIIYAVYGASGFGRGVMPFAREMLEVGTAKVVFIDDNPSAPTILNGHEVYSYQEFLSLPHKNKYVCIAIADNHIRKVIVEKLIKDEIHHWSVQASTSVIMDNVEIGEGSILCSFTHFTSNIRVGKFFHANYYSYVAHDCIIGDFVTFAPGVKCNGNIIIEDYAYVGTGAIIKQGTPDKPLIIGKGAVIGMGAVVTKNVPAGITVVGNPAKPLVR